MHSQWGNLDSAILSRKSFTSGSTLAASCSSSGVANFGARGSLPTPENTSGFSELTTCWHGVAFRGSQRPHMFPGSCCSSTASGTSWPPTCPDPATGAAHAVESCREPPMRLIIASADHRADASFARSWRARWTFVSLKVSGDMKPPAPRTSIRSGSFAGTGNIVIAPLMSDNIDFSSPTCLSRFTLCIF